MPSALLLPVLTCAAVLLVSGVAKLRAPGTVDAAFTSLEVPKVLDTALLRRLSPWVEVVLAVGLLLAGGAVLVVVATLTLLLFVAYLVLVIRAVRRPEPVDCGCFGALGDSEVTRITVWRNVLLVLTAALAVVAGLEGVGVLGSLGDEGVLSWVAAAALTAAVAVLVTHRSPAASTTTSTATGATAATGAEGEYERQPTPHAAVLTEDGTLVLVTEQTLVAAHLLVFLSPGCGPCGRIGPDLPGWSQQLGPVVVRGVMQAPPDVASLMPHLAGHAWYDPYGITRAAFGVGTPAAVLLGTDGKLAGGPVQGEDDVRAFVAELTEHLREAQAAAEAAGLTDAR